MVEKRCERVGDACSGPVARPGAMIDSARRTGVRAASGFAAVILALSACRAPDRPAGVVPPLPQEAQAFLLPDSARGLRLSEGVFYRFAWSNRGPWAVHMVSADMTRCELGLVVVPALAEDGVTRTRRTVTRMAPWGPQQPLAGVNGDFFGLDNGVPVGPEVTATTTHFALRPAVSWGPSRRTWIGDPVADGNRMGFGPDTIGPGDTADRSRLSVATPSCSTGAPRQGIWPPKPGLPLARLGTRGRPSASTAARGRCGSWSSMGGRLRAPRACPCPN